MTSNSEPVACTLTTKEAASQVLEWTDLRSHATSITALDDGARMVLPATLADQVADLAEREAACCTFLDIFLTSKNDDLVLEITTESEEGQGVIALLAGLATEATG